MRETSAPRSDRHSRCSGRCPNFNIHPQPPLPSLFQEVKPTPPPTPSLPLVPPSMSIVWRTVHLFNPFQTEGGGSGRLGDGELYNKPIVQYVRQYIFIHALYIMLLLYYLIIIKHILNTNHENKQDLKYL